KSERSKLNFRGKKAFAKRYAKALRKVIDLTEKAPLGFLPSEPGTLTSKSLGIDGQELNVPETLRNLRLLLAGWCQIWDNINLKKGLKASADDMRVAAGSSVFLCAKYQIEITATKNGKACRTAAVLYGDRAALYGDPGEDFRHHIKRAHRRWENLGKNKTVK